MKKVMKNKKVIAIMAVGLLAILLTATGVIASPPEGAGDPPVESKINYQGHLSDSEGSPLSGIYDMEFQFWDSASGGSQVGSTITKNSVEVTNGLFSAKLDVNQSDFNGQGLWVEVTVEGETLNPRQEILPVPYALSLKPGAKIEGNSYYGLSSITTNNYGLYGESSSASLGAGVIGKNTGGVGDGIQAMSNGRAGIFARGEGTDSYGGFFISENDHFDLALGGSVGRINTDPDDENSDLILSSNNDVIVRLDNDGGEDGVLRIKNSGGNDVCTVNEDGNVHITGGLTAGTANVSLPIAYGVIGLDGIVGGATPNVSCSWNAYYGGYEISIAGENFYGVSYVLIVTPCSPTIPSYSTLGDGSSLLVQIFDIAGNKVQSAFSFVIYKP